MRTFTYSIWALGLVTSISWGRGLSDLAVFSSSMREMERTYSDPKQRVRYKKALEAYDVGNAPVTRDFEKTFSELRSLWTKIEGVGQKLVVAQKPLVFEYPTKQDTYKFERVSQPLHAVWLLQNLRNPSDEVCSDRDNLLVDRWTPLLKDTHVFAIEKNGSYLGTTITLVPTKTGAKTILLVVPSGNDTALPEAILEAFIRDYRKKVNSQLPFALLSKVTLLKPKVQKLKASSESADRYEVQRLDDDGKKVGTLGPVTGFTLVDPLAKKLVTAAPVPCGPFPSRFAKAGKGSGSGGNSLPSVSAPDPGNKGTNIVVNSSASANSQGTASANSQLEMPKGVAGTAGLGGKDSSGPKAFSGLARDLAQQPSINNTTNNYYGNNKGGDAAAVRSASPENDVTPQSSKGSGNSYLPPGFGSPSYSKGHAGSSPGGLGGAGSIGGVAGLGNPNGSGKNFDQSRLSPMERDALRAAEKAERALANGEPVPQKVLEDLFRGRDRVQDPELKKEISEAAIKAYLENSDPAAAYNALKNVKIDIAEFAKAAQDDLCHHCKDCDYCKEQRRRMRDAWLSPFFLLGVNAYANGQEATHSPQVDRNPVDKKLRGSATDRVGGVPYLESQFTSCGIPPLKSCPGFVFRSFYTVKAGSRFAPARKTDEGAECSVMLLSSDEVGTTHISEVLPRSEENNIAKYTIIPGDWLDPTLYKNKLNYMLFPSENPLEEPIPFVAPCPIQQKRNIEISLVTRTGPEEIESVKPFFFPRSCDQEPKKPKLAKPVTVESTQPSPIRSDLLLAEEDE